MGFILQQAERSQGTTSCHWTDAYLRKVKAGGTPDLVARMSTLVFLFGKEQRVLVKFGFDSNLNDMNSTPIEYELPQCRSVSRIFSKSRTCR